MFENLSLETLASLFTRDNITLALSIFGSIGTVFTFIHTFITNRKTVNVRIIGHRFSDESLLIYMAFENNSRLPISITGISVSIEEITYPCIEPPVIALETTHRTGKTITSHHEYKTLNLPINLSSLGGASGYVYFEIPEANSQNNAIQLMFSINSNRGLVIKKKLSLGHLLD